MFTHTNEPEAIAPEYLDENFNSLVFASDNLPPQNYQAEEAVLGAILLDPDAMPRAIAAGLNEKSFFYPPERTIFKTAKKLYDEGEPVNLMTVTSRLYDCDRLNQVGGQPRLAELVDQTISSAGIEANVTLLNEKAWKRDASDLAAQINKVAYDKALSAETAKGWLTLKLDQLAKSPLLPTNNNPTNSAEYSTYNRIISELRKIEFDIEASGFRYFLLQKLAKRHKMNLSNLTELYAASQADHITGEAYTIAELIKKYGQRERQWLMTGLLPKQGVTVLHAKGGVGKTRLAYNLACNLVVGKDWGDFGVTGFEHRILIFQTDETMGNTIGTLQDMGYDVNGPNIKVVDHWSFEAIPQLIRQVDNWKPTMVIIDSITSNNWQSPHEESKAAYAKPLLVLKDVAQGIRSKTNPEHPDQGLAWGHKTQFLVIHHSNVEGRSRGTTAIVNAATQVISIKRVQEHEELGVLVFEKSRDKVSEKILIKSDPSTKGWEVLNTEYDGKFIPMTGEFLGGDLEPKRPEGTKEAIVKFLRGNPNQKFTVAQLEKILGGSQDYLRAACGKLASTGRIERQPGLAGHAHAYYFKADIGFSIERVASGFKDDHPPIAPHDHPYDSDPESDFSEGDPGDHQKSKKSKNNFSKNNDQGGSPIAPLAETTAQQENEPDHGGDHRGDHPSITTILPKTEENPEIERALKDVKKAIARKDGFFLTWFEEGEKPDNFALIWARLTEDEQTPTGK